MATTTWKPEPADYFDALAGQNPWHSLGYVPKGLSYNAKRLLTDRLWKTLVNAPWRFQVVLGPRRVGKTVCLYQTVQKLIDHGVPPKRLWFMRMDHPLFLNFPLGGWVQSLLQHENATDEKPLYLFLDEVNYTQRWDLWMKTFYDEKWPVQIVATSSSVAALRNRKIESGIGRWSEQYLTPYNFLEYLELGGSAPNDFQPSPVLSECLVSAVESARGSASLNDKLNLYMLVGGFPEIILNELDADDLETSMLRSQQTLRNEAVQRVTGMDLPQVFHVQHPIELERLLYLLAGQMCGMFSASNLSSTLSITRQTISQYIDYLEKAFLVFTLPAYARSEEKVQRRGRKVFFVDGAVRNAALQRGIAPASDPKERGYLVENLVASHLYALTIQNGARLFHWREKNKEVDFVYDNPSDPMALEVTNSAKHSLKNLLAFKEQYPAFENRCFLVSAQSRTVEMPQENAHGIGRIPLDVLLIAISGCVGRALGDRLGSP